MKQHKKEETQKKSFFFLFTTRYKKVLIALFLYLCKGILQT